MAMNPKDEFPGEVWKAVPNFEDQYEVSDRGRVRSLDRIVIRCDGVPLSYKGKLLRHQRGRSKNFEVLLPNRTPLTVGALVLAAFRGPCPPYHIVERINGNLADDSLENLRYKKQITPESVTNIRRELSAGKTQKAIADNIGVSQSTVSQVHLGVLRACLVDAK